MKNLKKLLAIILSITMVMCSTLPSVASEIEVIDETTKSKIEEQLREDLGEERANEILNGSEEITASEEETTIGENADDVGAKLGESEEEETTVAEEETTVVEEEETVGGEQSTGLFSVYGARPEDEENQTEAQADEEVEETTTVGANACGARPEDEENQTEAQADEEVEDTTMAEPVELKISIASKSIADKTLYGADEPWMYWRLEDNETGKTIIFSSTDEGKTGTTGIVGNAVIDYGSLDKTTVTKAVFEDEIVAETCEDLFHDFVNLSDISNIANLKTGKVQSMRSMFESCAKISNLDLSYFDTSKVMTMKQLFFNCHSLASLNLTDFETLQVEDMSNMFSYCVALTSLDLSSFKTENVENMKYMFNYCQKLEQLDLKNFDTSNVNSMEAMFNNCSELLSLDISSFNTEEVGAMERFLGNCSKLVSIDLSSFATSKVVSMKYMFSNCSSLEKIIVSNKFVAKAGIDAVGMFDGCTSLVGSAGTTYDGGHTNIEYARADRPDLGKPGYFTLNWMYWYLTDDDGDSTFETIHFSSTNPGGATGINCGPNDAIAYVGLGKDHITKAVFDNEINAVTCKHFFFDFKYLTNIENLNKLETGNVTSMNSMFFNCLYLSSIDLSKFNTGNVEDMFAMFAHMELSIKELDLKSFNTENVTDMGGMFFHCHVLEKILVSTKFNTTKVANSENMFTNCTNLVGGASTTYNSGHTDKVYARIDRPGLGEPGYFTRAPWMYWYLNYSGSEIHFSSTDPGGANPISSEIEVDYPTGLAKSNIDFAVFDNEINAVTCKGFFAGFTRLSEIRGPGTLKTNNVKDMTNMFYNCQGLMTLSIYWDTSNVEDMTNMFGNCQSLDALGFYKFDTSKVKTMDKMFENCEDLDWLDLSKFDTSSVTTMASMFKNCKTLDNLILSSKFTTAEVTDMESMFESCEDLNNPDLSSFNTSKVTNMKSMFKDCTGLVKLDLTGFNTSNVELMEKMFYNCSLLITIIASDEFGTGNVSDDGVDMFDGCVNLVGGKGTTYDDAHKGIEYARIDGGTTSATPGYFTDINPPTPPAPTPTYPQNYSSDRDDGGGGSIAGPLVDVIIPAVTYLPIVKNILATLNNTTSKWTKDAVANKHKLNIINQNGTETPATLGFYNYTNVVTHIVNNVPVHTQTNDTYVFDDKGNMITGWVRTADGKWYLFEYEITTNEGKMVIGWKKVQGAWYYFGTDGVMLTNAYTPDGHYVGPDGKWVG